MGRNNTQKEAGNWGGGTKWGTWHGVSCSMELKPDRAEWSEPSFCLLKRKALGGVLYSTLQPFNKRGEESEGKASIKAWVSSMVMRLEMMSFTRKGHLALWNWNLVQCSLSLLESINGSMAVKSTHQPHLRREQDCWFLPRTRDIRPKNRSPLCVHCLWLVPWCFCVS